MKPISLPFLLLMICLFAAESLQGQNQTAPGASSDEPTTNVQFPNTPIPVILMEYERITGRKIIRDVAIQDQNLIVQTSGKLTYAEAAEFIEKSLLLNGYAILPTEVPGQYKIIAFSADKKVGSEGLPVISNPDLLPPSDQVVTYIMPLSYLLPAEAAESFAAIVELHPYGKITPLENSSAIVVTENASVIRRMIELREHLDIRPVRSIDHSFSLERADAEEVAKALIEILDIRDSEASSNTTAGVAGAAADARTLPSEISGSSYSARPTSFVPRIQAIPRANSILVVASPLDMDYIERIIEHLDAPAQSSSFMEKKLKFLSVSQFLEIASDILQRGVDSDNPGGAQISGDTGSGSAATNAGLSSQSGQSRGATSGNSSSSASLGAAGSDAGLGPQSVVIGKTLLVADNIQNMLIASGPPENLRLISELLEKMDVRPHQIQISAVIAQLNLGDDFEFGFDMLRSFEPPADGTFFNGGGSFKSRTGQSQNLLDVSSLTDVSNLLPAAQGFTFYGQINQYLDTFISALNATNRFRVLSRPTVYTVNNRQALIQTGQRIAVPRSTLSSVDFNQNNANQIVTANIDFENVVLEISVLPLINSEGEITLQIQQRNDSIIGSQLIGGDEIPTIGTQSLGTTVIVDDGGTVLLGGLITEQDRKSESGLPLFTNLPLVGHVFGSTNDSVSRQELLIFIQPKIITNHRDQMLVDQDMKVRTEVAEPAGEFAEGLDDNTDLFQSQDFHSPEQRIKFFQNIFKRKNRNLPPPRTIESSPPPLQAVPIQYPQE